MVVLGAGREVLEDVHQRLHRHVDADLLAHLAVEGPQDGFAQADLAARHDPLVEERGEMVRQVGAPLDDAVLASRRIR